MISGKTKYYAILGDPIEQALSPIIHNAALKASGEDAVFLGCRVEPGKLKEAVAGARALEFSGLAVTMPYKREIIPYLDAVSKKAEVLDSVNVVSVKSGRLIGDNTDGDGFVRSLLLQGITLEGKEVLLFGAGGAARGIALSLLEAGIKQLFICNLYQQEADSVIEMLHSCKYENVEYVPFEQMEAKRAGCHAALIVNATSLGMGDRPSPHVNLVDWEKLDKKTIFADIVHKPLKTPFLEKAESMGFHIITGEGMLLHQGILAYKLLTGKDAPENSMRNCLEQWLHTELKG